MLLSAAIGVAKAGDRLVEDEDVDVASRRALIGRDLRRNGALRGLGVRPSRRFDVLE